MSKHIEVTEILLYHDGPVLFTARDVIGTSYICQLIEQSDSGDRYIGLAISKKRLAEFLKGQTDLRSIFENPEVEDQYFIIDETSDEGLVLTDYNDGKLDETLLPEEGLFMSMDIDESDLIQDARDKKALVLELTLNPPESDNEPKMSAVKFAQVLTIFQSLVKNSYIAFKKTAPQQSIANESDLYGLDAYAVSPGSFKVRLQTRAMVDLLSDTNSSKAFTVMDQLVALHNDVDACMELIKKHSGRVISSYKNLLDFIVINKTPIRYTWATPNHINKSISINKETATPLLRELESNPLLSEERVSFVGNFPAVRGGPHWLDSFGAELRWKPPAIMPPVVPGIRPGSG